MIKKLKKMEEKVVVGSQAKEIAKQQKKELRQTRKQLEDEVKMQAEL